MPHPSGPRVGDQRSRGDDAVVVRHQLTELPAVGRQDPGQHRGSEVGRGQQQPLVEELAHLEGLVNALPAGDVLVEERGHHRVRVYRQVPAELARRRPQAGPREQGGRLDRAAGHDHGPGAHRQARPPAPARADEVAGHPGYPGFRPGDPVHPAVGEQPGAERQRTGHAGHQHRPFRAGRAAAAAVAGARAVQLVPPVRDHGPAPGLRSAPEQLGIPSDRLRVLQADGQPGLDRGEVGVEVPLAELPQALLLGPPPEHPGRCPPGHAPVHHRGPADAAALGVQHGGPADRHPAPGVAVQGAQRPPGFGGERLRRAVAALLDHDHVHPGLGQFRGHGRPARP